MNTMFEVTPIEDVKRFAQAGLNIPAYMLRKPNALLEIIKSGSAELAEVFIASGADVNLFDSEGSTALQYAVQGQGSAQPRIVKRLLETGAYFNARNKKGRTATMSAAIAGNVDAIKLLAEAKADLNAEDVEGRTALMLAVIYGQIDALKALIAANADVNKMDKSSWTALTHAASLGRKDALTQLIAANAALNSNDIYGDSPLLIAAREGHDAIAKALIAAGADIKVQQKSGPHKRPFVIQENGEVQDAGAAGTIHLGYAVAGWSPLMLAAANGLTDTMKILLASGADDGAVDTYGKNVLMIAAENGRVEIVKILLTAASDLHVKCSSGKTALMYAASSGSAESVRLLLAAGAHHDVEDRNGQTALALAAANDHLQAAKVLLDHGADPGSEGGWGGKGPYRYAASAGMKTLLKQYFAKE